MSLGNIEPVFTDSELREMKVTVEVGGTEAANDWLRGNLDAWEMVTVNMAVIGESGVGKSTFINAIRDVQRGEPGYADVGFTETTVKVTAYNHPKNPFIKLWDLPGVGTPKFPQELYLEKIEVDKFDCFIVITASRFTENDGWLSKEIMKRKKSVYFVRTKIGQDIDGKKKAKKVQIKDSNQIKECSPDAVIDRIRIDMLANVKMIDFNPPLFLIDSLEPANFDFERLSVAIIKDLPDNQRSAMLLSVAATSVSIVRAKMVELRSRLRKTSIFIAAAAGAIPIAGIVLNLGLLWREAIIFGEQLGLDKASLERRARHLEIDVFYLENIVNETFPGGLRYGNIGYLDKMVFESASNAVLFYGGACFSGFFIGGEVIAAPMAAALAYSTLDLLLNRMEAVALEVVQVTKAPMA